jgi:hypothetical protein
MKPRHDFAVTARADCGFRTRADLLFGRRGRLLYFLNVGADIG